MTPNRVIEKDVCVLGAGASGMYAATRLKELGRSVVVVEKTAVVGGHAQTYRDPAGAGFQDMGVRIYPGIAIIKKTFRRWGVPLKKIDLTAWARRYLDIRTGQLSEYKDAHPLQILWSLVKYSFLQRTRYAYISKPGFQLPASIPEDLLQPFDQFLRRHKLDKGYAPVTHYLQGFGPVRDIPTLYALKNMRPAVTESILFGSFYAPVNGCDQIYQTMAAALGPDLLLQAGVESVRRSAEGVEVTVKTSMGTELIRAKKLIVTFPPLLNAMGAFDLSAEETALLGKLKTNYYWTTLVRVDGLPPETVFFNVAGTDTLAGQQFPGMYTAVPAGVPGLHNVLFGSETDMTDEAVKAQITADLERMSGRSVAGNVKVTGFELFLKHAPFGVTTAVEHIRDGFYTKLAALQGTRNTYYAGAAVDTNDTSSVWTHAEDLVTRLRF